MKKIISAIMIVLSVLMIAGCNVPPEDNSTNINPQNQLYKVSSLIEYNNSLCESTGYSYMPEGFNSGMKVILKDNITGELIEGYATSSTKNGGGSVGSEGYTCEEQIDSENVLIFAYAKGYAPLGFKFLYPKNQLATIEINMIKSCSGGMSFFDNLALSASQIENKTISDQYITESTNMAYEIIKEQFGLEKADYTLECIEGNNGRGGFIKAKGNYKYGTPFELYYHFGWCSSGGSDCGYSMCFSSTSKGLFDFVKGNSCTKLSSRQQSNGDPFCTGESYDNSKEVQDSCIAGGFERIERDKKTLSIIQISNRCMSAVNTSSVGCLEN